MPAPVSEPWWRPFRATEGVLVALVDLAEDSAREAAAYAWLDDEERERCERFAYSAARRQFLLCRAALRVILCEQLDCRNADLAFRSASTAGRSRRSGGNRRRSAST